MSAFQENYTKAHTALGIALPLASNGGQGHTAIREIHAALRAQSCLWKVASP